MFIQQNVLTSEKGIDCSFRKQETIDKKTKWFVENLRPYI